jgi:conjugal transfer/entry exclusion protein
MNEYHTQTGPGTSRLAARIDAIYNTWTKAGHINAANQEEMEEFATAFAILQYNQKYPLEIRSGPQYSKTVQAQTLFHNCRKANKSNIDDNRKYYKHHVHASWISQLGYSIKNYIRNNKGNILSTLGLIIAMIVLFYRIDAQVSDIEKNRLDPLSSRISGVEDTFNAQLFTLQSTLSSFSNQLLVANETISQVNSQGQQASASINSVKTALTQLNITQYSDQLASLQSATSSLEKNITSSAQLIRSLDDIANVSVGLCSDSISNFHILNYTLYTQLMSSTTPLIASLQNQIDNQKNMSVVLLDLTLWQSKSGTNIFYPSPAAFSIIPFAPKFAYGKAIQCFANYSCSITGPGLFRLSVSLLSFAPTNALGGFYFGWKDVNATTFLGTGGFALRNDPNEGETGSEAFVNLLSSQTMLVAATSVVGSGTLPGIYGADSVATLNRAVIEQLR